jgi:hypothetical protein
MPVIRIVKNDLQVYAFIGKRKHSPECFNKMNKINELDFIRWREI